MRERLHKLLPQNNSQTGMASFQNVIVKSIQIHWDAKATLLYVTFYIIAFSGSTDGIQDIKYMQTPSEGTTHTLTSWHRIFTSLKRVS